MADVSLLGSYVIPGPSTEARRAVAEAQAADRLGMGAVWESELQSIVKDAGAICGYLGHATENIRIGTSITHLTLRHPMIQASWGATMQALTGNRYEFGFGRSFKMLFASYGAPAPTLQMMADYAMILRQIWRGEPVTYDGPAGKYTDMVFRDRPDDLVPPPMHLAAIGPKTLELAGRHFDGVFFHPFMTPRAVAAKAKIVRDSAERAGRDPSSLKIYHELVTAPDMEQEEIDEVVGARIAAYFSMPGLGDLILDANGWDGSRLDAYRETLASSIAANESGERKLSGRKLYIDAGKHFPPEWIAESAVVGTASECAEGITRFIDAGADEVILHGVTADRLGPTTTAFAKL
ncbi:TIGR03857 family LLM class F420-dependent oxidoreductase [Jatrophihabitans sp.]|uniref:TIGR03857 family LLM class F420-dependent oxidoreductase n=1 Tax=Jatrophihabitans sp. TaxID=1932789 RepID=UPI0030C6F0EB|nr:putative Coenzyme F420-dependent N(10)-methylenetetrahydromethanopterin reductase [Jatrophihabitans sp.]